jgi:predicted kinase
VPTLRITIGPPGSGKTTHAREWVEQDPTRFCRVNRDDLRTMLHGAYLGTRYQEEMVTSARDAAVTKLLRTGISVICDDTNLRWSHVERLRKLASRAGADFEIVSMLDVPVETCIERDQRREAPVGEKVIMTMVTNHLTELVDQFQGLIIQDLMRVHGWSGVRARTAIDQARTNPLPSKQSHRWADITAVVDSARRNNASRIRIASSGVAA